MCYSVMYVFVLLVCQGRELLLHALDRRPLQQDVPAGRDHHGVHDEAPAARDETFCVFLFRILAGSQP